MGPQISVVTRLAQSSVPEPGTVSLLTLALARLAIVRMRKHLRSKPEERSVPEPGTLSLLGLAVALVALVATVRRVKCPRCQKNLYKELAGTTLTALTLLRVAKREILGQDPLPLDAC